MNGKGKAFWDRLILFVKQHPRGILSALGMVLGLVLIGQNTHRVRAYFLVWTIHLPMVIWAVFYGGLGYLAGKGIEWFLQKRGFKAH